MLENICEVKETDNPEEVNAYLERGWKLLLVYTRVLDRFTPTVFDQQVYYSIGRPSGVESGEVRFGKYANYDFEEI